jgi:hypothetical protein
MKERFIKSNDSVYWVEVERYIYNNPVYHLVNGYYLGSYALGDNYIKHICISNITSCVVRHVDPQYVFTDEAAAIKMVDILNSKSKEID